MGVIKTKFGWTFEYLKHRNGTFRVGIILLLSLYGKSYRFCVVRLLHIASDTDMRSILGGVTLKII